MARSNAPLYTFNRGRISRLGLARTDLDRTRLSAETQTNWVPRTLGSMMLRPGLQYIGGILNNGAARPIPFVFSSTDTALLEASSGNLRVWVSDAVVQRSGSTGVVTGGTFTSTGLAGWTDADETGSTSEWVSGNYMGLTGTRYNRAIRRQQISAASGSHGLAVTVERGRPTLKVGSSSGGDDYFSETTLRPGSYSLKITSTGSFWIEFASNTEYTSLIDTVAIESSGDMVLASTWSSSDLDNLRWRQSGDVVFVSAYGVQQRRIERYATESWALVKYDPEDGPFRNINITNKQLTPSAKSGNITLACDQSLFQSGHVGGLFRITSVGQEVDITVTGADQWSDSIRVSGVEEGRKFQIDVTSHGSTADTIRVQRSVGEEGSWANVSGLAWTSTVSSTHDDGQDNQVIFYRIGSGTTDIGSTAPSMTGALSYASGGITGVARITSVVSATESSAIVLTNFGSTTPSELWYEGEWSNYRGWPSAVSLGEGRMSWFGKSKMQLSVSDGFESFDPDTEGDSGPINRSIGQGPVDKIEWALWLTRLVLGTQGAEVQAKTSSLEEPLTPSNFSLRDISTQGSANVQAVQIDRRALFVQAGGTRVMEITLGANSLDFETIDRTIVVPEIGEPSIVKMAVQRQPDTRVHCVRSDGTVGLLVTDPAENVLCWVDIKTGDADGTNGVVEDVVVLPGTVEDTVYYIVKRMVNGAAVRYLEKWAQESEARGGQLNKMADSFVTLEGGSTDAMTNLSHLIGETVIVWGDGKDLGTYTVSSTGEITGISQASSSLMAGLSYDGLFKSAKLAYAAQAGSALTQRKRVDHVGLILADTHAQGLQFGQSSDNLDPMPLIENGAAVSTDSVYTEYDEPSIPLSGSWDTDARLVLYGQAPRPVTVLGAVITMETKDKV